jgi:subtilisin family serine protease
MPLTGLVRRTVLSALAVILFLGVSQGTTTSVSAQAGDRTNVLITFASRPGPADQAIVRAAGGRIAHTYHLVPGIAASLPAPAVEALRRNPRIAAIEPDGRVRAYDAELDLTWGVSRIGAGTAHADGVTGAGVRVAVFDSGVDYTHFELSHAYAGGRDFVNDDDDPFDDNGHGTHVSGTIVAADDEQWVVGVAPGAQLFGLKVLDATGQGDWSDVVAGLEWAVDHGIQVTNHSYGDSANPGTLVQLAFANSAAAGLLHVAAAGNAGDCRGKGNTVGFPAKYSEVIAVGATDQGDARACFSSTGPALELAAPGDWIPSSFPNGDIALGSGTSMASPHVAGAAALVMSAGVLDATAVRNLLTGTAEDLGAAGRDNLFGFGLVNAAAAVAAAGPIPPAVHVHLSTDKATYDEADTVAFLTVRVTNEQGTPLGGVPMASFATTLDGVAIEFTFEETTTAGTYAGQLDITAAGPGQHVVTVEATFGQTGSDTAAFLIGSPPEAGTVHVPSITYSSSGGRGGTRNVYITVSVVDGDGAPVGNATVAVLVSIDGALWAYGEGATDALGQVTFEARNAPPGEYHTDLFAVVAGGLVWDGVTPQNSFMK